MDTPEHFVDFSLPWCEWAHTEIGVANYSVVVGAASFGPVLYTKTAVDAKYPGFVSAYESLTSIGCDRNFVTDVLKFCILRADGMDLTQFLEQSAMLNKIEAALAIGLSGPELAKMSVADGPVNDTTSLPDDFGHTPE